MKHWQLVQVQDLLHELVGGEGHGLGGDAADVVERKASVQSPLDPVLLVHVRQGLSQRSVQMTEYCKTFQNDPLLSSVW